MCSPSHTFGARRAVAAAGWARVGGGGGAHVGRRPLRPAVHVVGRDARRAHAAAEGPRCEPAARLRRGRRAARLAERTGGRAAGGGARGGAGGGGGGGAAGGGAACRLEAGGAATHEGCLRLRVRLGTRRPIRRAGASGRCGTARQASGHQGRVSRGAVARAGGKQGWRGPQLHEPRRGGGARGAAHPTARRHGGQPDGPPRRRRAAGRSARQPDSPPSRAAGQDPSGEHFLRRRSAQPVGP